MSTGRDLKETLRLTDPTPAREATSLKASGGRLGIRELMAASMLVFGALASFAVIILIWTSSQLRANTDEIVRDTRSLVLTNEVQVSLAAYQRLGNLQVALDDDSVAESRAELETRMLERLEEAKRYVGSPDEGELLSDVERSLRTYLAERAGLEGADLEVEQMIALTRNGFDQAWTQLRQLRRLNERQAAQARDEARRVDTLANITAAGAGLLLLVGFATIAWGVRRSILQPLVHLDDTVWALRRGRYEARAKAMGSRETAALAEAFNEMADALARQREREREFVAGVGHDLRNPLSSLKLGLDNLQHTQDVRSAAAIHAILERQIGHLSRMVEDLLGAARVESPSLELRLEQIDLRTVVQHVVEVYRSTTDRHRLVLSVPHEPVVVSADPVRLEQVFGNLVNNAIKYSPEGGNIRVVLNRRETMSGEQACVSITDEGIGIPSSSLPGLFLPFRRYRPEVAGGVGIGLAVVDKIVKAHGGRIDVDSEPDRGSTFTVILPTRSCANDGTALQWSGGSSVSGGPEEEALECRPALEPRVGLARGPRLSR